MIDVLNVLNFANVQISLDGNIKVRVDGVDANITYNDTSDGAQITIETSAGKLDIDSSGSGSKLEFKFTPPGGVSTTIRAEILDTGNIRITGFDLSGNDISRDIPLDIRIPDFKMPLPNLIPDTFPASEFVPNVIDPACNRDFNDARNFVIRRDPLVLDLDNDGLELIGASGAVLFDHNADGIKTGTGWARPDDGFLVRDLNGNGSIDTGRELFGIDTIKSNNTLATDGFDALRELDSNADGQITSADTAFSELKVWRDIDQNGISSANELFTLGQLGITSINTNGTSTGPQAGQVINNNSVALSTTFTQNGQTKTVGAIDLEANNFFTEFPPQVIDNTGTPIPITPQAQGLPQMNGAGMVRDMRAAASLDGGFAAAVTYRTIFSTLRTTCTLLNRHFVYAKGQRCNWISMASTKQKKGHAHGDI